MSGSGRSQEELLHRLLDEYGHVLRRAIARTASGLPAAERDDVEQEARMRVWKALRRDVRMERPASYLYRVARTATLDALRRLRARREEVLPDEGPGEAGVHGTEHVAAGPRLVSPAPSPETAAARRQEVARLRSAVAALPENRRRAVGLYLQGFSAAEIADLAGWTEPKARNLLYRGLADVRSRFETAKEEAGPDGPEDGRERHETV